MPQPIYLKKEIARNLNKDEILREIRTYFPNVLISLSNDNASFTVDGADLRYHGLDPSLPAACDAIVGDSRSESIMAFRASDTQLDFCLEDTWTYYFIVTRFQVTKRDPIVLLHLDDHTDMMRPLIGTSTQGVFDIPLSAALALDDPKSIEKAIWSGALGIGNFITPLFYNFDEVHVCHLSNTEQADIVQRQVSRSHFDIPIVDGITQIDLKLSDRSDAAHVGSYATCNDIGSLVQSLPPGRLIVHIDLDYFCNDYDGGNNASNRIDHSPYPESASTKLQHFFAAMRSLDRDVERWIVAASPGFCAARHWSWLINEINAGIAQVGA
jgi:hypothetical protein